MGEQRRGTFQCPICYDTLKNPSILRDCEHAFCYQCILQWLETQQNPSCPFCRFKVDTKKDPIISLRPRYKSIELQQKINSATTLSELREIQAQKATNCEKLEAECNENETKFKIEIAAVNSQIDLIRNAIVPTQKQIKEYKTNLEETLKAMPLTAPYFEQIYTEVTKNPMRLKSVVPYDDIVGAWRSARSHYQRHEELENRVKETRKQIREDQENNMMMRKELEAKGPQELSQLLDKPKFENLCKLMNWNYRDYVTEADDDDSPIYLGKRPCPISPVKRPLKKKQKIQSLFDDDLLNMDLF